MTAPINKRNALTRAFFSLRSEEKPAIEQAPIVNRVPPINQPTSSIVQLAVVPDLNSSTAAVFSIAPSLSPKSVPCLQVLTPIRFASHTYARAFKRNAN